MGSIIEFSVIDCKIFDQLTVSEEKFLRKLDLKLTYKVPQSKMVINGYGIKQMSLEFTSDNLKLNRKYYTKVDMFRDLDIFFKNLRYIDHDIDSEEYFNRPVKQTSNLIIAH